MRKFTAAALLLVGMMISPAFAGPIICMAPVPWPWPWAVGCPMPLEHLAHEYILSDLSEGQMISISADNAYVYFQRSDRNGVHSSGYAHLNEPSGILVARMAPARSGVQPYEIRLGVYFAKQTAADTCDKTIVLMSIDQPHSGLNYNYVLDPIRQDR